MRALWKSGDPYLPKYLSVRGADAARDLEPIGPKELALYAYGRWNPLKFVDPDGNVTHVVAYGAPYLRYTRAGTDHDVGQGFKRSAEASAKRIRARSDFNPKTDDVVLAFTPSTAKLVDALNTKYASGKIQSFTLFSHGYSGGAGLGGEMNNDAQLTNYDLRELNSTTVGQIDFSNFETSAVVTFNGCNIGSAGAESVAQMMADRLGGAATVKAFNNFSEFPSKGGKGETAIYNGDMIRSVDRKSQQPRYSIFRQGQAPKDP